MQMTKMGCVSSRRRLEEVITERDRLREQIRRVHLHALEESRFVTEFTAEESRTRWGLLDADLERVRQTGSGAYSIADLRRVRDGRAAQEAERFGIAFPGIASLEMCGWRMDYALRADPARDEAELKRVALRAARLFYLDERFKEIDGVLQLRSFTFGHDVDSPDTKWPAVWPWRRAAVLAPGWAWTAEQHAYLVTRFACGLVRSARELYGVHGAAVPRRGARSADGCERCTGRGAGAHAAGKDARGLQ